MATEVEVKALEMFREMVTKPEFLATMRGVIEAEAYKYVEELAESLFDAHEAILEAHRDIAELEEVTNDNIGFMAEKFDEYAEDQIYSSIKSHIKALARHCNVNEDVVFKSAEQIQAAAEKARANAKSAASSNWSDTSDDDEDELAPRNRRSVAGGGQPKGVNESSVYVRGLEVETEHMLREMERGKSKVSAYAAAITELERRRRNTPMV